MARIRTVKPGFWKSRDVSRLSFGARLLFVAIWNFADDEGRGDDDPELLKAEAFPYDVDVTADTVEEWISELSGSAHVLIRYLSRSRGLYQVAAWKKHQRINRPTPSEWPPPPGYHLSDLGVWVPDDDPPGAITEGSGNDHGAITDSSVRDHGAITDDSRQEGKGKEGKGKEGIGREGNLKTRASLRDAVDEEQIEDPTTAALGPLSAVVDDPDLRHLFRRLIEAQPKFGELRPSFVRRAISTTPADVNETLRKLIAGTPAVVDDPIGLFRAALTEVAEGRIAAERADAIERERLAAVEAEEAKAARRVSARDLNAWGSAQTEGGSP